MNFNNMTWVPPMWTTFRTREGEHVADAIHPMMGHGAAVEIDGKHWTIHEGAVFTTEGGRRQELVVTPAIAEGDSPT
jgi:hypothetical protein